MTTTEKPLPLEPSGYRILVKTYTPPMKVGSILLAPKTVDEAKIAMMFATVVKLGPLAYKDERFSGVPWCREGDTIILSKYAGTKLKDKLTGEEYRIINDDEVQGTTDDASRLERV